MSKKHPVIDSLNWRYATKEYDATRQISDEDLAVLKESVRLTATSYGLQPFKVFIVKNDELRKELKAHSFDQGQITDASDLFVFAIDKSITHEHIDNYMLNISKTRGLELNQVSGFGDYIKASISTLEENDFIKWNTNQSYIALGTLLQTAAELRIDATPIEGFNRKAYDEILNLEEQNLTSSVICSLGYRSKTDKSQFSAKVRKSEKEIFEVI